MKTGEFKVKWNWWNFGLGLLATETKEESRVEIYLGPVTILISWSVKGKG